MRLILTCVKHRLCQVIWHIIAKIAYLHWWFIFSCCQMQDSFGDIPSVTGPMEGTTEQGANLHVYIWLAAYLWFQVTAMLLCKNWLYLHFQANTGFTLLFFPRISCLLSDTSPHLSLYDIPFHFLFYTNIIFNKNNNSVWGKMAGEHTGRLYLSGHRWTGTQFVTTKCCVVQKPT